MAGKRNSGRKEEGGVQGIQGNLVLGSWTEGGRGIAKEGLGG